MVSGFGRFIREDENSKNMIDLRAYRCRIAVDDVREIPHRLSVVLGEEIFDIHVHLESSERIRAGGDEQPPPPAPHGPNVSDRGNSLQGGRREEGRVDAGEGGGEMVDETEVTNLDRGSELSINRGSVWIGGDHGVPSFTTGGWAGKRSSTVAASTGSGVDGGLQRRWIARRQEWVPVSSRSGGGAQREAAARAMGASPKVDGAHDRTGTRAQREAEKKRGGAEYISAGSCSTQLIWMKSVLSDFRIPAPTVTILCDNTSAINISKNPVLHSTTKHIELRYHLRKAIGMLSLK